MEQTLTTGERFTQLTGRFLDASVAHLPNIVGAVLLLLAGWLLATLLRGLVQRSLVLLDAATARVLGEGRAARLRLGRSSAVLGTLVFWSVLLFFITAAAQLLGLSIFAQWLARLIEYLPTLAAGLLIVIAGWLLSRFAADLIDSTAAGLAPAQRAVVARAAQVTILAGAVLVGAEQVGIKVTFLALFAAALLFAIAGGVVVATSLGARTHVANLIGANSVRQSYTVGQRIRVGGHEGRILELASDRVVLETAQGRTALPGRVFSEEAVVALTEEPGDA